MEYSVYMLSHVWLFGIPQMVAPQAPLSMELSSQEHWSGLPFPTPKGLPEPRIQPTSLVSSSLAGGFFYHCGAVVKNPPANAGDPVSIPGHEDLLEKEMATYSNILAWEIPWTEEPRGL